MMDISENINEQENVTSTRNISELNINTIYPVTDMKFINTFYGREIVVDIANEFSIFLPNQAFKYLDEHLRVFNKMVEFANECRLGLVKKCQELEYYEFIERFSMDLSELNEVSRLDTWTPSRQLYELNVNKMYEVTHIKTFKKDSETNIIFYIENNIPICLSSRTREYLNGHYFLFTQMMIRAYERRLGLRSISGRFNQIEFVELHRLDLLELNRFLAIILPLKKLSDLDTTQIYHITNMKFVDTKDEHEIVTDINNTFSIILTKHTCEMLKDNDFANKLLDCLRNNDLKCRYLGEETNRIEFIILETNKI